MIGMIAEAEAAPRFGDDDAVSWIMRIVANLDGQVCADLIDMVGEQGDILCTLIDDATDPVAVGDQARCIRRTILIEWRIDDVAVGDAAGECEQIAPAAFQLFGCDLGLPQGIPGNSGNGSRTDCNYGYVAWNEDRCCREPVQEIFPRIPS